MKKINMTKIALLWLVISGLLFECHAMQSAKIDSILDYSSRPPELITEKSAKTQKKKVEKKGSGFFDDDDALPGLTLRVGDKIELDECTQVKLNINNIKGSDTTVVDIFLQADTLVWGNALSEYECKKGKPKKDKAEYAIRLKADTLAIEPLRGGLWVKVYQGTVGTVVNGLLSITKSTSISETLIFSGPDSSMIFLKESKAGARALQFQNLKREDELLYPVLKEGLTKGEAVTVNKKGRILNRFDEKDDPVGVLRNFISTTFALYPDLKKPNPTKDALIVGGVAAAIAVTIFELKPPKKNLPGPPGVPQKNN